MHQVYCCPNPVCGAVFDRAPAGLGQACPKCFTVGVTARDVEHIPPPPPVGEEMPGNCPRRNELGGGHVFNWPEHDVWRMEHDGLRTCSFCGSMHPLDVIRVLGEGWIHERSDKGYKGYLRPKPGTSTAISCPKFYIMHFTREQIERLNVAIGARPA